MTVIICLKSITTGHPYGTTSHERKHQLDKGTSRSLSNDDSPRVHKKHTEGRYYGLSHQKPANWSGEVLPSGDRRRERDSVQSNSARDQRTCRSEKSNSEVQDCSDSSNLYSGERKIHHHGICHKKQSERRGQYPGDSSSKSQHKRQKHSSEDEKIIVGHKKHTHRHHYLSEEPNHSNDQRRHHREKESTHDSRSSRQLPKSKDKRSEYDRWEMVEGLDDEYKGRNYHKRHRIR